jgi:hypothetical protein
VLVLGGGVGFSTLYLSASLVGEVVTGLNKCGEWIAWIRVSKMKAPNNHFHR